MAPDVASGRYADPAGMHVLDHEGEFFRVRGPLNLPRPPQGRPVLFQAGSSQDGRRLAGRHAEAVFVPGSAPLPGAQRLYEDYKGRAVAAGRARSDLLVLAALSPVRGATTAQARERVDEIEALTPDRLSLDWLSHHLGVDLSDRPLDEEFRFDFGGESNQVQTVYEGIRKLVDRDRFTRRELYRVMLRRRFLPGPRGGGRLDDRAVHGRCGGRVHAGVLLGPGRVARVRRAGRAAARAPRGAGSRTPDVHAAGGT